MGIYLRWWADQSADLDQWNNQTIYYQSKSNSIRWTIPAFIWSTIPPYDKIRWFKKIGRIMWSGSVWFRSGWPFGTGTQTEIKKSSHISKTFVTRPHSHTKTDRVIEGINGMIVLSCRERWKVKCSDSCRQVMGSILILKDCCLHHTNTAVSHANILQNRLHPCERELFHGFIPELVSNILSLKRINKRSHAVDCRQRMKKQLDPIKRPGYFSRWLTEPFFGRRRILHGFLCHASQQHRPRFANR